MADPYGGTDTSSTTGGAPAAAPSGFAALFGGNLSAGSMSPLLGLLQGLGAASAPSRLPVTSGMVIGAAAGGLQQGLDNQAKLRQMDTAQVGAAAQAQGQLDQMTMQRQLLYGQNAPSADDLRAGRFQQLQLSLPTPSGPAPQTPQTPSVGQGQQPQGAPPIDPLGMIQRYENPSGNPNLGFGGTDLSKAPLGANGFPQWAGAQGPGGISHAAGLFQLEPQLWGKYAPALGVKDFSPASQKAVASAAYADQGWSPWTPYNPALAKAVASTPGALSAEPVFAGSPYQVASNAPVPPPQGGALGSTAGPPAPPQGAAPFGSLAPQAPGTPQVNPRALMQQLMMMRAAGFSPPPVMSDLLNAQMMPSGPARDLAMSAAQHNAGISPFVGGERPNAPQLKYNMNTGQYDVVTPPGYNEAVQSRAAAEAAGRGTMEPQPFVTPSGVPMVTNRATAFGAGMPPLQTGLSPQAAAAQNAAGKAQVQYGSAFGGPGTGLPATPGGGPPLIPGGLPPLGGTAGAAAQQHIYQTGVTGQIDMDQNRIEKELQPQVDKANDQMATANLIQSLAPRVTQGWTAETRADGARVLSALGASPDTVQQFTGTDPAAADVLTKMFLVQSAQAVRQMGAREPGSVMALFSRAYPNLETQPGATQLIENVLRQQAQRSQDEFAMAQSQHSTAVSGVAAGQQYQPLTQFTTSFNTGPHSSTNYLRSAQAMSGDGAAWRGLSPDQMTPIWALIPRGTDYLAPNGVMRMKP
jgi:hypothetical protein